MDIGPGAAFRGVWRSSMTDGGLVAIPFALVLATAGLPMPVRWRIATLRILQEPSRLSAPDSYSRPIAGGP